MGKQTLGGTLMLGATAIVVAAAGAWVFLGSGDTESSGDDGDSRSGETLGVIDEHRPEVGGKAPNFVLSDGRDEDKVIRLSDFRGKPVILNWYATWCGPCRAEIPDFRDAYDSLDGKLVIIGVNLQESPEKATGLLDEFGAGYPVVLDADGAVFEHYRGLGMPTTYFIDADGIIVEGVTGQVTEEALVEFLANLGLDYQQAGKD